MFKNIYAGLIGIALVGCIMDPKGTSAPTSNRIGPDIDPTVKYLDSCTVDSVVHLQDSWLWTVHTKDGLSYGTSEVYGKLLEPGMVWDECMDNLKSRYPTDTDLQNWNP